MRIREVVEENSSSWSHGDKGKEEDGIKKSGEKGE